MLESLLALSAATVAFVEFVKGVLMQFSFFSGLTDQVQSIVLQFIAFGAGVVAAVAGNVNVLSALPSFAGAPMWLGVVLTGLIAGTGSASIHVLLALLGVRAGVTAQVQSKALSAQAASNSRSDYSPWN